MSAEIVTPDKPIEHCGVAGIIDFDGKEAVRRGIVLLQSVQHRGQDSAGILTLNHGFHLYRQLGLVDQFTEQVIKEQGLEGSLVLGHCRYKIQGGKTLDFTQPILASFGDRALGLAHNGNVPESQLLGERLAKKGIKPEVGFDSSFLGHAIVSAGGDNWIDRVKNGLFGVYGSYSLVISTSDGHLIGVRDPWGNRPIFWGQIEGGVVVASEDVGFSELGVFNKHELKPGEIVDFSKEGAFRSVLADRVRTAYCSFEPTYFAYEASTFNGEINSTFRKRLGRMLAENHPGQGTVVTSVPDSADVAATAYAATLGKPKEGLIRKKRHAIKRSFMAGEMGERIKEVEGKYILSPEAEGRSIDVVDDSIVVGNTARTLNRNLSKVVGVDEIHFRATAPKIIQDCGFGVNMRSSDGSFVAVDDLGQVRSNEQIAIDICATTVDFPSLEEYQSAYKSPENYCFACVGGRGLDRPSGKRVDSPVDPISLKLF